MITELTPEQQAKLEEWKKDWLKKGLTTKPVDPKRCKEIVSGVYGQLLKKPVPDRIVIRPSPMAAWHAVCKFAAGTLPEKDDADMTATKEELLPFVWPYLDGHWQAGYFSYYAFFEFLGLEYPPEWKAYVATCEVDVIYPLEGMCIMSDCPSEIHHGDHGLHSGSGPALRYRDGWSVWALNGVRVPEAVVATKSEEMDTAWLQEHFCRERNAEIRREIVRKLGVDRLCGHLGTETIDKQDDYTLVMLDIGDGRKRPHLRMLNPSTGTWHVEGVSPDCKTVADALLWRNGIKKEDISEDGAEWWQQGDVLMKPKGATKFKPYPATLK